MGQESKKVEKSALRRKLENVSGKQLDSVQKETLAVSTTDPIVDRKHNRLPVPKGRTQTADPSRVSCLCRGTSSPPSSAVAAGAEVRLS